MPGVVDWIETNQVALIVSAAIGIGFVILSMIAIPAVAIALPSDYFAHEERPRGRVDGVPAVVRLALRIVKNALGGVLVVAGIAMLVLPGQGVLSIVLGLLLIDFPGRYRLMKRLVRVDGVRRPLNWMRRRAGKGELELEGAGDRV